MIQPSTLLLEQFAKKNLQNSSNHIISSTSTSSSLNTSSFIPSSTIPSSSSSVPKEEIDSTVSTLHRSDNQMTSSPLSTTTTSRTVDGMEEDEDDEIDWNVIQHCSVYLPITSFSSSHQIIVRILPQESFCLSTRDRVPFMLFVETLILENSVGNLLNNVENQIQNQFKIPTSKFETALSKILQLNR
jgi:hypothetical protein